MALQASVAASLAPGPLLVPEGAARLVLGSLSDFPDRRVVRIVRLSGLGDLWVLFEGSREL